MKTILTSLSLCILLLFNAETKANLPAKNKVVSPASCIKKVRIHPKKWLTASYFFMLMNDGCFHLFCIVPPSYIGPDGHYYATWTRIMVDPNGYEGTTTVCLSQEGFDSLC